MVSDEAADDTAAAKAVAAVTQASSYSPDFYKLEHDPSFNHGLATLSSNSRSEEDQRGPHQMSRTSLTDMWPTRSSPSKSSEHSGNEENSFALFSGSFDDLHDANFFSSQGDPFMSPKLSEKSTTDILLPTLQSKTDGIDYTYSDVSPIKLGSADDHSSREFPSITRAPAILSYPQLVSAPSTPWWVSNVAPRNPFYVVKTHKQAFSSCRYLLPCLHDADNCSVNLSNNGSINHYRFSEAHIVGPENAKIASRRVETAICAFGGSVGSKAASLPKASTIFRLKGTTGAKQIYENRLNTRYYLKESRLSWGVEENPPVYICASDGDDNAEKDTGKNTPLGANSSQKSHFTGSDQSVSSTDTHKMKYRCKMCGQLKQNHQCVYSQSLQRSIGVMVYPAINSYTADEPGVVAPPLTKMNNFVSYTFDNDSPRSKYMTDNSDSPNIVYHRSNKKSTSVTPETFRASCFSPQSSLSGHSEDRSSSTRKQRVYNNYHHHHHNYATPPIKHTERSQSCKDSANVDLRKRKYDHLNDQKSVAMSSSRSLYMPRVALRPEHYRTVSHKASAGEPEGYDYPPMPITFDERKRLSDTLFALSKSIPTLTADCAMILRAAREYNDWDGAVADLLTQVVVALYCEETDLELDGLRKYLSAIGISC